jgi:Domain of unknown function (DUF6316)
MHRKGEAPGTNHIRSARFALTNGVWYFSTREGIDVGPFHSRHSAVRACDRLTQQLAGPLGARARETVENFVRYEVRREDRVTP